MWPAIEESIKKSFPVYLPATPEVLTNIMLGLMTGRISCWQVVKIDSKRKKLSLVAVMLFSVNKDGISGTNFLNIMSVCAFSPIPGAVWRRLYRGMKSYGKRYNVDYIIAQSENPVVLRFAKAFGSNSKMRSIRVEVN